MIRFHIPGEPIAKGRPRATTINGAARLYTPTKTVNYESLVALAAQQMMRSAELRMLTGPLHMEFRVVFGTPKSWTKKRLAAHAIRPEYVTKRPDLDNLMKALSDGMNGVVYADDCQIAQCTGRKVYGDQPGVWVTVSGVLGNLG